MREHRLAVRDAVLDATATLVAERGLASVTMSALAERTAIGRATLYKYFPDVESALRAWHVRQIEAHLAHLEAVSEESGDPTRRLEAVLEAYATLSHRHEGTTLAAALHQGEDVDRAERRLRDFVRDLVAEGARAGRFRDDVAPHELAAYCLHALSAASALPSKAAVRRLVTVTLDGLRPHTTPRRPRQPSGSRTTSGNG